MLSTALGLISNDIRSFKWNQKFPDIIMYAQSILHRSGPYLYNNLLKGIGNTGRDASENYVFDQYESNEFLPSISTVKRYTGNLDLSLDPTNRIEKLKKFSNKEYCLMMDATDILAALVFSTELGAVFGIHNKIIKISELEEYEKNNDIINELAKKVIQVLLVSLDGNIIYNLLGSISFPVAHTFTVGEDSKTVSDFLKKVIENVENSGNKIKLITSDGAKGYRYSQYDLETDESNFFY
jgi:hypothetical protein